MRQPVKLILDEYSPFTRKYGPLPTPPAAPAPEPALVVAEEPPAPEAAVEDAPKVDETAPVEDKPEA